VKASANYRSATVSFLSASPLPERQARRTSACQQAGLKALLEAPVDHLDEASDDEAQAEEGTWKR